MSNKWDINNYNPHILSLPFGKGFTGFMLIHTSHLILAQNFCSRDFCYSHFKDGEIEAKRLSAIPKAIQLMNGAVI